MMGLLAQLTQDTGLLAITSVLVAALVWVVQKGTRTNACLLKQLAATIERYESVERAEIEAHAAIIEFHKKLATAMRGLVTSQMKMTEAVADLVVRLKVVEERLTVLALKEK